MLYWLLVPLRDYYFFFNVFRYITVRTALAGVSSLLLVLFLGPLTISHLQKKGTPTMGGILFILATLVTTLLWGDLKNQFIWVAMVTMLIFGAIGFIDDYAKIKKKIGKGLGVRQKFLLQIMFSGLIGFLLVYAGLKGNFNLHLHFPFFKEWTPYLGWAYLPWIMLILISSSNSDGLAIGLMVITTGAITALTYIAGHALWSEYLNIARVPQAAELTVFAGALSGACLGFLWYNCHPFPWWNSRCSSYFNQARIPSFHHSRCFHSGSIIGYSPSGLFPLFRRKKAFTHGSSPSSLRASRLVGRKSCGPVLDPRNHFRSF